MVLQLCRKLIGRRVKRIRCAPISARCRATLSLVPLEDRVLLSTFPTQFALPFSNSAITATAAASDGALWFTENAPPRIGRITTTGILTEFSLPAGNSPVDLTAGPDGSVWFALPAAANQIVRISAPGFIRSFRLSPGETASSLGTAPNGELWFTEATGIGVINSATGVVIEYAVRIDVSGHFNFESDGSVWFTSSSGVLRLDRNSLPRHMPAASIAPFPGAISIPFALDSSGMASFAEVNLSLLSGAANTVKMQVITSPSIVPLGEGGADVSTVKATTSASPPVPSAKGMPTDGSRDTTVIVFWYSLTNHPRPSDNETSSAAANSSRSASLQQTLSTSPPAQVMNSAGIQIIVRSWSAAQEQGRFADFSPDRGATAAGVVLGKPGVPTQEVNQTRGGNKSVNRGVRTLPSRQNDEFEMARFPDVAFVTSRLPQDPQDLEPPPVPTTQDLLRIANDIAGARKPNSTSRPLTTSGIFNSIARFTAGVLISQGAAFSYLRFGRGSNRRSSRDSYQVPGNSRLSRQ
jgi:virginiamycin B lyase